MAFFETALEKCIMTMAIAAVPVVELRGAIPAGIAAGLDPVSYTHLDVYKRQGLGGIYEQRDGAARLLRPFVSNYFLMPSLAIRAR